MIGDLFFKCTVDALMGNVYYQTHILGNISNRSIENSCGILECAQTKKLDLLVEPYTKKQN